MRKLKDKIHNTLIGWITGEKDSFRITDVNKERRVINLGLYGMNTMFLKVKEGWILYLLVKWYGYKFEEQRIRFELNTDFYGIR